MPIVVTTFKEYRAARSTPSLFDFTAEQEEVRRIIDEVCRRGDAAVREFTRRFDGVEPATLTVEEAEFAAAEREVPAFLKEALQGARQNIEAFHRRQLVGGWWETGPGRMVGQQFAPISPVGVYVPGGTAAYPSTVLMTVVPAKVAGVEEIYVCTPPGREGKVPALTLVAAREAGATAVFKIGGAQAVAAMACGTASVPRVHKIVGPGNIFVTLAKKEVFGLVGIDLLAGPSEIMIVADAQANPTFIAADLLSQAEHDPLARALLLTPSPELAECVRQALSAQLERLPRREIAARALAGQGAILLVENLDEAWEAVNEEAPEHLELHLADPWAYLKQIKNAGAVFIGPYAPESLGDYWAGSNHVLPTAGAARYASPLGVADFLKSTHLVYYTREALLAAAPHIENLARAEGLEAHARAAAVRRKGDAEDGAH